MPAQELVPDFGAAAVPDEDPDRLRTPPDPAAMSLGWAAASTV